MEEILTPKLQLRPLSSLAKVFPSRICGAPAREFHAACGQEVSFQIAYRIASDARYRRKNYAVQVSSPLAQHATLYTVGTVPSLLPAYPDRHDDNYLTVEPGLFPDPLYPVADGKVIATIGTWRAVWVSVRIPVGLAAGTYPLRISFQSPEGLTQGVTFRIHVHAATLPPQKLIFTQWFHCDCIASVHNVKIFSEKHWELIGKYMKLAAEHGMNMILTPVLTPPLDTEVGGERPTVQLVEIVKDGDHYTFDFAKLGRFVDLARACGIRYFEINQMFTQWGANAAPKVVARVNGRQKKIFGWNTCSYGDEYANFLRRLIPALIAYLLSKGLTKEQLYFHVSDEPSTRHLETYNAVYNVLAPLLDGCRQMDALSDIAFYHRGTVDVAVVATNHIEPWIEAQVPDFWAYYCCSQCVDVANRFFAMPSARNRIIGVQLFKYNIPGFLQWGYNFYYTQRSRKEIDPYACTDADAAFPSGDSFSVYPYKDGVIPSLRQKVFGNALEDMRLLTLLAERIGHARAVDEIERVAGMTVTFSQYPREDTFFDELYRMIFSYLDNE